MKDCKTTKFHRYVRIGYFCGVPTVKKNVLNGIIIPVKRSLDDDCPIVESKYFKRISTPTTELALLPSDDEDETVDDRTPKLLTCTTTCQYEDDYEARLEQEIQALDRPIPEAQYMEAFNLRRSMDERGSKVAYAETVALRIAVPEIVNLFHSDTPPHVVWKKLDDMFRTMSNSQYKTGVGGLAAYYEKRRDGNGYNPIGGGDTRVAHMDHVFVQWCCPFNHPRFYAVMPGKINTTLNDRPPSARRAYGLQPSTIRAMGCDMVKIHKMMKERGMFNELYSSLPALPVLRAM